MTFNSYQRENSTENRYQYNQGTGKKTFLTERVFDLGLNVDFSKYRTYDYVTGRWWQVDPLADETDFTSLTPYNYSFNNPVRYNDPYGDFPIIFALPFVVEAVVAVAEVAMATTAGVALVNLAKSADTSTPGAINTPAVSFAMSSSSPGELTSGKFFNSNQTSNTDKSKIPQGTQGGERAGKDFTPKGKKEVVEANRQQNNGQTKCADCKTETTPAQKSKAGVSPPKNETRVDHTIPKSRGGDGSPSNGRVLCDGCNNKKSDKMPEEYYRGQN